MLFQSCAQQVPAYTWVFVPSAAPSVYNSMVWGCSISFLNSASHWAPTAPSTTRWSQLSVTHIMLDTRILAKSRLDTLVTAPCRKQTHHISVTAPCHKQTHHISVTAPCRKQTHHILVTAPCRKQTHHISVTAQCHKQTHHISVTAQFHKQTHISVTAQCHKQTPHFSHRSVS